VKQFASRYVRWLGLPTLAGGLIMPLLPARASAPQLVATVHSIQGGLGVIPPHAASGPGRVKEPLFAAYGLRTAARQRASVRFVDQSDLYINQRSDVVLSSGNVTAVRRGEVAVTDARGTHHQVVTATAVASAIGTVFDVFVTPRSPEYAPRQLSTGYQTLPFRTTTVSVVTGRVVVSNQYGRVTVLPGFWTHVKPGTAPTAPTRHHARDDVAWKRGI
jgi:ferric-dicitrate binding protein FerR (iron transport regulator)